jgi:hypothetical protein
MGRKSDTKSKLDGIMRTIRAKRGLSITIAKACGIERAAVYQWTRVPIERVHVVAPIIGKTPEQIRPDIFKPKARKAAHGQISKVR